MSANPFNSFINEFIPTPLALLLGRVNCLMKILVQNCLNHLYLKSPTEWTADAADAKIFPSSENALLYCTEHDIPAVQIVLKFQPDRFDITLPITEECTEGANTQKALLN
jgi:hypothetical protein